jgi:hypothetical protein
LGLTACYGFRYCYGDHERGGTAAPRTRPTFTALIYRKRHFGTHSLPQLLVCWHTWPSGIVSDGHLDGDLPRLVVWLYDSRVVDSSSCFSGGSCMYLSILRKMDIARMHLSPLLSLFWVASLQMHKQLTAAMSCRAGRRLRRVPRPTRRSY